MNDQTANPARGEDAERAAFEAWHRSKFATKHSTGQPTRDMHNGAYAEKYGPEHQQQMWEVWQAARRAPALGAAIPSNSGELDAAGLPALLHVKTWQERMTEASGSGWAPHSFMAAEIADLRAQLAAKSQGEPLCTMKSAFEAIDFLAENKTAAAAHWVIGKLKRVDLAAPALPSTPQTDEGFAAALRIAVDQEYPIPETPHASVTQRAIDNRAAMWRGITAARKITGAPASTAHAEQAAMPDGWQLVPIEPTIEMIAALGWEGDEALAIGHGLISQGIAEQYKAALAVAPAASLVPKKGE